MTTENMTDNSAAFVLDERLQRDCMLVEDLALSRLLLMNDSNYRWFILVPRRAGVSEIFQLTEQEQLQLQLESTRLGKVLMTLFSGHKLNLAALGNVVAQLHVHHIVRYRNDIAWPDPVWGKYPAQPYETAESDKIVEQVSAALAVD